MVENRPEHEQVLEQAEVPEQPGDSAQEQLPQAISEPEPVAHETEPAHAPEQAFDLAADQRERAEEAAGFPEPGFATTTASADAPHVEPPEPKRTGIAAMIVPPVLTIAIATGLVVGAAKLGLLPQFLSSTGVSAPQGDLAALDEMNARIANLEARPAAPSGAPSDGAAMSALAARVASLEARPASAAPTESATGTDSALSRRVDELEKTVTALRDDVTALRAQADKLDATVSGLKAAPAEAGDQLADKPATSTSPPAVDATAALAAIDQRLGALETASKAAADKPDTPPPAAPADDTGLRRLVAATMLDLTVRQGEPYAPLLKAATPLAGDPAELKPLDTFAATGVPTAKALGQELLLLLPKILPDKGGSDASFIDRFQANAERLVKIQRSDAVPGIDRTAIVGRLTADARQGDLAAAVKEMKALAPADRAPVQSWIDKVEARDKALAASQHFATAALTALQKPSP